MRRAHGLASADRCEEVARRPGYLSVVTPATPFARGGILAMRAYQLHFARIARLVLIAPCLDWHALSFPTSRILLLRMVNRLLGCPRVLAKFSGRIHDPRTVSRVVKAFQKTGCLEVNRSLEKKLLQISPATIAVLNAQINEILTTRFEPTVQKHPTSCYFAMSTRDPLLRFDATLAILRDHFENVNTVCLDYPYHQPPRPFTYMELNRDFHATVDAFMGSY